MIECLHPFLAMLLLCILEHPVPERYGLRWRRWVLLFIQYAFKDIKYLRKKPKLSICMGRYVDHNGVRLWTKPAKVMAKYPYTSFKFMKWSLIRAISVSQTIWLMQKNILKSGRAQCMPPNIEKAWNHIYMYNFLHHIHISLCVARVILWGSSSRCLC